MCINRLSLRWIVQGRIKNNQFQVEDFVLILLNDTKTKNVSLMVYSIYSVVLTEISISEEYDLADAKAKAVMLYLYVHKKNKKKQSTTTFRVRKALY